MTNYDRAIRYMHKALHKAKQANTYRAEMGYGDAAKTLWVDGLSRSWVWARIRGVNNGAPTKILCTKIAPRYGIWIKVELNTNDQYEAIEYEQAAGEAYAEGQPIANVAPHGFTHGFYESDPITVDSRQLQPLQVWPTVPPSTSVQVGALPYLDIDGNPAYFPGGVIDLNDPDGDLDDSDSLIPVGANLQRVVIICLNRETGELAAVPGTEQIKLQGNLIYVPFDYTDALAITLETAHEPAAAVRLYRNHATIVNYDIFLDMRRWLGGSGLPGLLASQLADVTVANTTTETSIISAGVGSITIPANTLTEGATIAVKLCGYFSTTGSPILTFKVKLGGVELLSAGVTASGVTDQGVTLTAAITCRTTGASGSVVASGQIDTESAYKGMVNTADETISTTADNDLEVTATWSAASASNTITSQIFTMKLESI